MHVIINKIHPERHTIHTQRYDFKILGELCVNLEKTLALRQTNHEPSKLRSEYKAQDMEKHSGIESFIHYAREKATALLSSANSWKDAHNALARVGITLQLRGNGLILLDRNGGTAIKASSVGREFSKAKLEKRLGLFVLAEVGGNTSEKTPATATVRESYLPRPITGTSDLYEQYLESKRATTQARTSELAALWEKQKRMTHAVMDAGKLHLPGAIGAIKKRVLRKRVRDTVKARITQIRHDMAKTRAEIKARHRQQGFVEWLKQEAEGGNVPAIHALRKRGAVAPALVNITARDLRDTKLIASKIVHVTGRGTLFYKVDDDVFRDNGSHLSLKKEISDQGVKAALMIAMAKFTGQTLIVNGSDEIKARCVEVAVREGLPIAFSDPAMEQQRKHRLQHVQTKVDNGIPLSGIKNDTHESMRLARQKTRGMTR